MRLAIIGASGRTGQQVTEQALARGHKVTAIVRNPSFKEREDLRVAVADPCNLHELIPALTGQDAVISCLGQRPGGSPWLVRDAAAATLGAMQQVGLQRLVIVSGALLYSSRNPLVLLLKRAMATRLMDGRAAEDVVSGSTADWTIVRPPRLREGDSRNGYRIATGAHPNLTWSLQFRDLATCMLDLSDPGEAASHSREVVGVASL